MLTIFDDDGDIKKAKYHIKIYQDANDTHYFKIGLLRETSTLINLEKRHDMFSDTADNFVTEYLNILQMSSFFRFIVVSEIYYKGKLILVIPATV
jgi:hypothetical protein